MSNHSEDKKVPWAATTLVAASFEGHSSYAKQGRLLIKLELAVYVTIISIAFTSTEFIHDEVYK